MTSKIASLSSTIWQVWAEPLLESLGLYESADRSYGRWNVPFSAMEKRMWKLHFMRLCCKMGKIESGIRFGRILKPQGIREDAGFRLIVPDLPSHGFSSGLHVYQKNMAGFCSGLNAVLHDVAAGDQAESAFPGVRPSKLERRQTFMLGLSFGGLVAFSYALQYPASYRYDTSDTEEVPIDGLVGIGAMVAYNTRFVVVGTLLRWLFTVMLFIFRLGRLEVILPHKKAVDKDPKAKNQHDDLAGRISVIANNVEWMVERSPPTYTGRVVQRRQLRLASYSSERSTTSRMPTTPSLADQEAFMQDKLEGFSGEGHLLPEHLCGWREDGEGEKRLYRMTWNFREDTRPFIYDAHAALSPIPAP
ncbi:related to lysophospholipase [Ustilago sp. UG-2017a]|nr:related to lysophospholipase [Ustilago sp. UG-2017a]